MPSWMWTLPLLFLIAAGAMGVGQGPSGISWPAQSPRVSAPPVGYAPPGFYYQIADSNGVSNTPAGTIVIDPWIGGMARIPGGRHSTTGAFYAGPASNSPAPADVNDFIYNLNVHNITGSGSAGGFSFTVGTGTDNTADEMFCRCNDAGTKYPPAAASTGTCAAGTSTTQLLGSANPEGIVIWNHTTGRYALLPVNAYNGCNATTSTVSLNSPLPFAVSSGDKFQFWSADGVHPLEYYYRWLSQQIIEARWETTYHPIVNMATNGTGESTTGWSAITAGTSNTVNSGYFDGNGGTPGPKLGSSLAAVRKKSVWQSTTGRVAGDSLRYSAIPVTPYRTYTARVWSKFPATGGGNQVQVRPLDGTSHTTLSTSSYTAYVIDPAYAGMGSKLTAGTTAQNDCYSWCLIVVNFNVGASTSVDIEIGGLGSTTSLFADELEMFPAMYDDLAMHYIVPAVGNQLWYVHSDSRGIDSANTPNGRVAQNFDFMKALLRTNWKMHETLAASNTSISGISLANAVAGGLQGFVGNKPQFAIIHLGVNDLFTQQSGVGIAAGDSTYTVANITAATDIAKQHGAIPVLILEPPARGDTNSTSICQDPSGHTAINCYVYINNVETDYLHGGYSD